MNKKAGPLKVWQWAAMVAGLAAIYYIYKQRQANALTANPVPTSTVGPLDPTTGLPYASSMPPGGTAAGSTTSVANIPTLADQVATVTDLVSRLGPLFNPAPVTVPAQAPAGGLTGPTLIGVTPGTTIYDPGTGQIISIPGPGPAGPAGPQGPTGPGSTINGTTHTTPPAPDQRFLHAVEQQLARELNSSGGLSFPRGGRQLLTSLEHQGFSDRGHSGTFTKKGIKDKYYVFNLGGQQHIRRAAPAGK